MILGKQVSEEEDDEDAEVPELGPLSSLATEWASLGWDICCCCCC